jgi:hypothetical protein
MLVVMMVMMIVVVVIVMMSMHITHADVLQPKTLPVL